GAGVGAAGAAHQQPPADAGPLDRPQGHPADGPGDGQPRQQQHLGEGLVRTPSDFGVMGLPPTHPELLDWLAGRFVKDGWSLKKLHRLILTSNTYRMGKGINPAYQAEDPENKLLWRVPYRRLEVEALRDAALAASGRLDPTMYGTAIFPYVPPGARIGSSDPDKIWPAYKEEGDRRRTVYAFIKRSLVVPLLEV